MATSWISFGPDLEPLETDARRGVTAPGPRRDGIAVVGSSDEVASRLAEASGAGGWCRLEEVLAGDRRRTVYVNGSAARLVVDEE